MKLEDLPEDVLQAMLEEAEAKAAMEREAASEGGDGPVRPKVN